MWKTQKKDVRKMILKFAPLQNQISIIHRFVLWPNLINLKLEMRVPLSVTPRAKIGL